MRVPSPKDLRHGVSSAGVSEHWVVTISCHTGDVKDNISVHGNRENARRRARKLNALQATATRVEVVLTDLFAGEPNFSWKKEWEFWLSEDSARSKLSIIRNAREVANWHERADIEGNSTHGFVLKARDRSTVMFINPKWD